MSSTNFECIQHTTTASHIRQYPRATANAQEEELEIAVKQYKPRHEAQPGDVTILACHANGYPKELYEPVWDALFNYTLSENACFRIRGIWIMDVANQGDSGVLNDGKLGNEPSWHDFARDYLNLVNQFRREMPRPIVGFGHSMGGSVMLDLALMHPRLLTSVIAIEPTAGSNQKGGSWPGVASITFRKDRWRSADDAIDYFRKAPIHKRWNSRVLELYRQYGLKHESPNTEVDAPGSQTILKTSKHQEALNFARASFPASPDHGLDTIEFDRENHPEIVGVETDPKAPMYRPESTTIFKQLPSLRPSCFYIYGKDSTFSANLPWKRKEKMQVTGIGPGGSGGDPEGRVEEMDLPGSHFFPFEIPDELGRAVGVWLDAEMTRWREAEAAHSDAWSAVPVEKRGAVSDEWVYWTKRLFKTPAKSADGTAGKSKL